MVCRTPSGKESTLTGKEDISVHYKRRPQVKHHQCLVFDSQNILNILHKILLFTLDLNPTPVLRASF
jgi:hypothetical protein